MEKSVEQKIGERKKEAEQKNIGGQAAQIVRGFDHGFHRYDGKGTDTYDYSHRQVGLVITLCYQSHTDGDGGGYTSSTTIITYKGDEVFQSHNNDITTYIPGEWEELLPELVRQAQEAASERKKTEDEKVKEARDRELAKEAKRFGL